MGKRNIRKPLKARVFLGTFGERIGSSGKVGSEWGGWRKSGEGEQITVRGMRKGRIAKYGNRGERDNKRGMGSIWLT